MVNVRSYKKRDGTKVKSHERRIQPRRKSYKTQFTNSVKDNKAEDYHLPIETAIYVPSTTKGQKKITKLEFQKRINRVKNYLFKLYGGFSAVKIEGAYEISKDNWIKEDVVKVTAFSTKDDFEDNKAHIIKFLKQIGSEWHQHSMGYEFEGDLHYIAKVRL